LYASQLVSDPFSDAGTGIAPIKSLLVEHCTNFPAIRNCLIFGNRNSQADYFFEKEWPANVKIFTAFSRDQSSKVYVQHRIIENGEYLWDMIHHQGAFIYLSGNAKRMPVDVSEALEQVFAQFGGLSVEDASKYLKTLEKSRRFQQECWS
jgi:sulfite reductase alpha subunit-like flavoprotein